MNSKTAFISDFEKEQNSMKLLQLNNNSKTKKGIPCTFSEINDLTYQINIKNVNLDQSKYTIDSSAQESRSGNCICYQEENSLLIVSQGGSQFTLPLEQEISAVFPLNEGLLIEFHVKHELKMFDILSLSKKMKGTEDIDFNYEEKNLYSYVTLNQHPLNPLKILGIFRKSEETAVPWFRSQERIVFVSDKIPLIISYNVILQRHAMHYIRLNVQEKERNQNQLHFLSNFYTLHNTFTENPNVMAYSYLLADRFYEDSNKEDIPKKCELVKGSTFSEMLVLILIEKPSSYVKIYSLDILNHNFDKLIAINAVKKITSIDGVRDFFTYNLMPETPNMPKCVDIEKKMFKGFLHKFDSIKTLVQKNQKLDENIVLFHSDGHFSLYQGAAKLFDYNIPIHIIGMESTTLKSFNPTGNLLISQRIKEISNFQSGHAHVLLDDERMLEIELCPKISNKFVLIILRCLSNFIHEKFYHKMLTDIITNCFALGQFENLLGEETKKNNNVSETQNLVNYFVFVLKLCGKNGISQAEDKENADEELPTKKVKTSLELASKEDSARKDNPFYKKNQLEANDKTFTSSWKALCQSSFHAKENSKFDRIFQKRNFGGTELVSSTAVNMLNQNPHKSDKISSPKLFDMLDTITTGSLPKITISLQEFYQRRIKILRTLHLLYQDLKLIKTNHNYLEDLSYLLYCFSKYLDHYYSSYYSDYYLRENPKILERFANDLHLKQLVAALKTKEPLSDQSSGFLPPRTDFSESSFNENTLSILEREPPDVMKWIQEKLLLRRKDLQSSKMNIQPFLVMPIAFNMTKFTCKIFEMLTSTTRTKTQSELQSTLGQQAGGSRLSDLLNRNLQKNVQDFLGNHDALSKIETLYPLYHQNAANQYLNDEEKFRLNYRTLCEGLESEEEQVFLFLIKKRISISDIDKFIFGLSIPIYEVLLRMRLKIPVHLHGKLPKLAFKLVSRDDLYRNSKMYTSDGFESNATLSILRSNQLTADDSSKENINQSNNNNRSYLFHNFSATINKLITGGSQKIIPEALLSQNASGEAFIDSTSIGIPKQHSSHEIMLREASKVLDTTQTMRIKAKYLESIPEDKWDAECQNILNKICFRRFSALIGKGALNFGTLHTLITETLKIPKINLSAYCPPNDTRITLEIKENNEKDIPLNTWPDFHNGVATGLNLYKDIMQYDTNQLRTWIFYQRPETPKNDHGGYLFGLGLLGFLDSFLPTDIYQYLRPGHDATSVGILLGLAASRIGKMDENTSKTLCLHIPNLIPPTYDIEISINVQTAAIVGIGLLHKGTCNRVMTEMTLSQIGRKPISDKSLDRDGYSLASGYALGLINLGKGTRAPSIKDLDLDLRLIRFVEGGKIMEPPKSMLSSTYSMDSQKCSSVREGNFVNTHITAPAALVALALIYLKSNNREIASKLTIPNSFSSIEFANPNNILLKMVTKNLIMWDEISNTKEFIYNQIPDLIRFIFEKPLKEVHNKFELIYNIEEIDFHTVCLIYTNIIAGCIMTIGLKYAGTGDKQACKTIVEEINFFRKMKVAKCDLANDKHNKNAIDNFSLCTYLSVCILSLSLIMSGTCDSQCLKLFKGIKRKVEEASNMHYGFSMAIHMAIGFLFLGNGSHSFGRSDLAIAALLISTFPHFPSTTNDNKYHLQALRHFYVLASEARLFHAIDVDSNRTVNVNLLLEIETNEGRIEERCQTPHLIQVSKKVVSLKLLDDKYYDLQVRFKNNEIPRERLVYVKRKYPLDIEIEDCKRWFKDQKGTQLIPLKLALKKLKAGDLALKSILSFSNNSEQISNREMLALTEYKLRSGKLDSYFNRLETQLEKFSLQSATDTNKSKEETALIESYFDLFCEDRLEFFHYYQKLAITRNLNGVYQTCHLQNLNIVMRFYEAKERMMAKSQTVIFSDVHLSKIRARIAAAIDKQIQSENSNAFREYLSKLTITINQQTPTKFLRQMEKVLQYCVFYNVPLINDLDLIKKSITNCKKLRPSGNTIVQEYKEPIANEEKFKKMLQACLLYLYLSFPLCPQQVLEGISNTYFN